MSLKESVRSFWEAAPCGTREAPFPEGSREFFASVERTRYEREEFIPRFARFEEYRGKKVLEVGFGAGTDFIRFARAGAIMSGVDLTQRGAELLQRRLELESLRADVRIGDAENLPFADGSFDLVYSWGVIHHTADTPRAAREIMRVVKPGGRICVMLYHRRSLVALQYWLRYGLFTGRPWRSLSSLIAGHIESAGTKAYTAKEAAGMFAGLARRQVTPVLTPYDLRLGRRRFLPRALGRVVPAALGWFLVVEGVK